MTSFYVANCTTQHHNFMVRLPEHTQPITIPIRPGGQEKVPGDLSPFAVDAVIKQHVPYGMMEASEGARAGGKVPLLYSLDKVIGEEKIFSRIERNRLALIEEGQRRRAAAAIAISQKIETQMFEQQVPDRLKELRTSVQEDSRSPEFAEGIMIAVDQPDDGQGPPRRGRGRPRKLQ